MGDIDSNDLPEDRDYSEAQLPPPKTLQELLRGRDNGKFILLKSFDVYDRVRKEDVHFPADEVIYINFFHTEEGELTDPAQSFYCIHRDPGLAPPIIIDDVTLQICADEIED